MSSFIAAGTAYATHGVNTIPFFIFYSMFGFQRIGDLIWAAGDFADARLPARRHRRPDDARRRRAAASGRQQPSARVSRAEHRRLRSGVRLRDRRHHRGRHPADVRRSGEHLLLPDGDERAVSDAGDARRRRTTASSRGCTASAARRSPSAKARAQLFGSGAILPEVIKAQEILESQVRRRRRRLERHELQRALPRRARVRALEHAASRRARRACRTSRSACKDAPGVFVAASDYVKALPDSIDRWLPRPLDRARHRRLRPQREPRQPARVLRGGLPLRRAWRRSPRWRATARSPTSVVEQAIKTHNINPEKAIRRCHEHIDRGAH